MVHGRIYIGECNRPEIVNNYVKEHDSINKVIVIGKPLELDVVPAVEQIKVSDTILYKYYYRLLQEINMNTLLVLNEAMTKTNRYDLSYNCIRKYMIQTHHRLIFQYYPIIRHGEDFMILYDMITPNPFLKEPYKYMHHFEGVVIGDTEFNVQRDDITFGADIQAGYEAEKETIISQVKKDADIIPRRLLKWVEKQKPKGYDRLDMIKPQMKVCVSNLKVDEYYYNELIQFGKELQDARENISH